jgi:hypothetical protein
MMDAHFADAFADWLDVAGLPKAQSRYARSNFGPGPFICEI